MRCREKSVYYISGRFALTKPINIYLQSRINEELPFNRVECHSSGKAEICRIHEHEMRSLRIIVDKLIRDGVSLEMLDGFFYGYQIPHIGKEFDLLKFTKTECLNIELKSRAVPLSHILAQLKKNKYYLAHLGKKEHFYTVVTDTLTCYTLDEKEKLRTVDFSDVKNDVIYFQCDYLTEIDNMFRAADYLVSPFNTPDKFINGEYFLTPAQEHIQKKILKDIKNCTGYGFFSLTGKPGTGKTLLLYDVAKKLAAAGKALMIHCGKLSCGQERLNESIKNFHVISTEYLKYHADIIDGYHFILADETHRIYPKQYKMICEKVIDDGKICLFSSDPEQILSSTEKRNGIVSKINSLPLVGRYELSERIRTNKNLMSFIDSVRNLNKKPRMPVNYGGVTLSYANNYEEARNIIAYFKKQGYVFINYSKSDYKHSPYSEYEEDFDTHHVIGQEFDNVLMLMDNSFYYDENGILRGIPHPDPDYLYPNLFYQGITRVREKIALVIVDAPELFGKISSIFSAE